MLVATGRTQQQACYLPIAYRTISERFSAQRFPYVTSGYPLGREQRCPITGMGKADLQEVSMWMTAGLQTPDGVGTVWLSRVGPSFRSLNQWVPEVTPMSHPIPSLRICL